METLWKTTVIKNNVLRFLYKYDTQFLFICQNILKNSQKIRKKGEKNEKKSCNLLSVIRRR